jgi:threonine synthase
VKLKCVECGKIFPPAMRYECDECAGILEVTDPVGTVLQPRFSSSLWKYSERLPVEDAQNIVSLHEGMTPIDRCKRIEGALAGFKGRIWTKNETVNPTGSFKDRLISVAISRAKELGFTNVVCASSGNAGASTAAYAAKAGMQATIVAPAHTPREKLTQISAYGAEVVLIEGHYSHSYRFAQQLAERLDYVNLTTTFLNPYGTEALKTIAYELYEQLEQQLPDYVFIPIGSGPLLKGLYQGFSEILESTGGKILPMPKLIAVQAQGCAPIVAAYESNSDTVTSWNKPSTIASGIADPLIGYEKDGTYTLRLTRASGGRALAVTDEEIRQSMKDLAGCEGLLAEPTGACSVAGLQQMWNQQLLPDSCSAVCMVTGHGFKNFKVYQQMEGNVQLLKGPDLKSMDQLIDQYFNLKGDNK